ncbi:hypothetical protein BV20DRAFT_968278 [Pilatotrama ljubarskyi]|nr:hypothetical protein BV20DRAFT_968278 [Pilatotrama ljubarskyi]
MSPSEGEYYKDKDILFLPDVFGISVVNHKLLVDDFAGNGFRTIIPDLSHGGARPEDATNR